MSKSGVNYKDLKKLSKEIEKLDKELNKAIEQVSKEIAARLLRKVIKRTPIGDKVYKIVTNKDGDKVRYKKGKSKGQFKKVTVRNGGTLQKAWNISDIRHFDGTYQIEIYNNTKYASYVEFGHRTFNHRGWVKGQFMLTISEREIKKVAPKILERRIQEKIRQALE